MSWKRPPGLALALAAALAARTAPARALDLSLQLQPGYAHGTTDTRDEAGQEHSLESSSWLQKYRLSLDAPILPQLVLSAGGVLDWSMGNSRVDGLESEFDGKRWSGFSSLKLGGAFLSGGLDYSRRDETSESTSAGVTTRMPRLVSDSYSVSVGWRPAELPSLDLQLARTTRYDWAREILDQTAESALLASRYKPVPEVDLGVSFRAGQSEDRLTAVHTRDLSQSLLASYADTFRGGRATTYVSYNASARQSEVSARGTGGMIQTVQVPAAGLSIVEVFPAVPTQVTLNPNAALVDGNLTASAGLNLGYSAAGGGLRQLRDMGAQFADVVTPVNAVYLWVDRQLPSEIAAAFAWEVYRSDDNVTWTPVAITGAVQFGLLQNRFEIPVERTQARYLKVVTRPIPNTLTVDPQFSEIFVTEAQFLLLTPADEARGKSSTFGGNLNAAGRVSLLPAAGLAYDVSGTLTHRDSGSVTWAITNGLSASRRLNRTFAGAGRVERVDSDSGRGHESTNRWGASLTMDPLPTLNGALTYSGQYAQNLAGDAFSQTAGLFGRADMYEGIALSAGVTHGRGFNEAEQSTESTTGSASVSLVPNRFFTANGSASYTESAQRGGEAPDRSDWRAALDVAATVSPFPALALSGGASRFFTKTTSPQTLANFSLSLTPFPGGDLSIRYGYQETYDSSAELRTRVHGPALRWNIRPGWFFDSGYTFQESSAPAEWTRSRAFNANLTVTLR